MAALVAPQYRLCLDDAVAIEQALRDRQAALAAAGFAAQVALRDHGALLFFHRDGPAGPRFRSIAHRSRGVNPTMRRTPSSAACCALRWARKCR